MYSNEVGTVMLVYGGNTGKKVHLGWVGSTSLGCGRWVKAAIHHYKVGDGQVTVEALEQNEAYLCKKCFPDGFSRQKLVSRLHQHMSNDGHGGQSNEG